MNIKLHYQDGRSDKVYNVQMERAGEKFVVNFQYGRRGGALNVGTKTAEPVSQSEAVTIFNKLVAEKSGKGYKVTESDLHTPLPAPKLVRMVCNNGGPTPFVENTTMTPTLKAKPEKCYQTAVQPAKLVSGVLPQLLNALDEAEAQRYILSDEWCAQEKFDGHHKLVRRNGDKVEGINKKGQIVQLPKAIVDAALSLKMTQFVIDGEHIGEQIFAFDLLEQNGDNLRDLPYATRMELLYSTIKGSDFVLISTAWSTSEKQAMWNLLRAENREGIVFKRKGSFMKPGRPNSGGDMLKCKFWASLSARIKVLSPNGKAAMECELLDANGKWVSCGGTTMLITGLLARLKVGNIVELKYLYALRGTGILYQSSYAGLRDDVDESECTVAQLKYKPEVGS